MGLDNDGTKFLFAAHAAGVSFQNTAMLGRQNFFLPPASCSACSILEKWDYPQPSFSLTRMATRKNSSSSLGAEELLAIDNSNYEGAAIVTDLNVPIAGNLRTDSLPSSTAAVSNYVFNFPQAIKNCMEMLRVGGHYLAVTPANNFAATASINSARKFISASFPRKTASPSGRSDQRKGTPGSK